MRHDRERLRRSWWVAGVVLGLAVSGCRTVGSATREEAPQQQVDFDPVVITGDLELEKLNDEELFAKGTAAFGAEDYKQAARFFDRIVDFHPASPHREAALYNAGLSHERLKQWEEAFHRFGELSDPQQGTGDALEASFREATMLYMLDRYEEAAQLLDTLQARTDLPLTRRFQALVERGVCEKDGGDLKQGERTLRQVLDWWESLGDKQDEVDDYYPAQAQFHLAEVYRLHSEAVQLEPLQGVEQLAKDLDYKAELLLSAQGHYLRCIRLGHGEWATAAGSQVGLLYEKLWDQMVDTPAPPELSPEEAQLYRYELRRKIRVLLSKAINAYELTLETAVRIGAQNPYIERTRESLQRMKELLVAEARLDEEEAAREAQEAAQSSEGEAAPTEAPAPPAKKPTRPRS